MSYIHPTAIIHNGAVIADNCNVDAYAVVGPHVVLGKGTRVGPHAVLDGYTRLGDDNVVYQFASIGSAPQDLKFRGEASELIIGNRNVIREFVTLQPGTARGGMRTTIGNSNLFMVGSHVGHDVVIGDHNIFANYASLAGHVTIANRVTIGGLCGVHQFIRLGELCILGAGSMVAKDVPPFCIAQGDRAKLIGINRIGLQRAGVNPADTMRLRALYRQIFYGKGRYCERLESAHDAATNFALGAEFYEFLSAVSKRGIATARRLRDEQCEDDNDL